MQTDRNLLFGVLAFQDEYIDVAQLAAVCRAWVADKTRSIPQLLVERQWLKESERDELERKVERKLKRFVGDAHATLGAVADSAICDVLKQVDDPDVRAAIPELADEGKLGLRPDRPGWNPNLQNDVDPASQPDKSEPRYTRGQLQGEGSFGIVWLAYDKQLDREVALKELKTSKSRNPDLWKRFLREAQVTGKLQHPNIVPVYELDPRASGEQPFYTMKPVKGRTLRKAIDAFHQEHKGRSSETLELNRLLQSFVQVCEALAYAHSRDVVHRDLKPENVVLGDFGEVIVLDWGEAKLIGTPEPPLDETSETVQESDAPLVSSSPALRISGDAAETPGTKLGTAKGSPGYMSPEQVRGDVHLMEPRTDVYGLGAILFDILIGHPPHQPTPEMKAKQQRLTIEDWRSIILANPTPRAREHNATVPVSLDAICAKAMEAELSSRYSSANDLAKEVQRFLADEPVSVCQDPLAIRARRWMKHHQVAVATTAAAVLMAVIGLGALLAVNSQHQTELERKNEALTDANEKKDEQTKLAIKRGDNLSKANKLAAQQLYTAHMKLARTAFDDGHVDETVRLLGLYRPIVREQRGTDDFRRFEWFYWDQWCHSELVTLKGHLYQSRVPWINCIAFSPDGERLASASWDNTAKVWDANTGLELLTLPHADTVQSVAFSPNSKWLATASGRTQNQAIGPSSGEVKIWDVATGEELRAMKGHAAHVSSVGFSPDGEWIASASHDKTVKVWETASGKEVLTLDHGDAVAFSPNGLYHSDAVDAVAFSPDGKRLASVRAGGMVTVWDVAARGDPQPRLLRTFNGGSSGRRCVAFSPSGRQLASASGAVNVWDIATGQELYSLQGHTAAINSVAFSTDGKWLASASGDPWMPGEIKIWDASTGHEVRTLKGHTDRVESIAFSPDGQRLASASFDGTVKIWDVVREPRSLTLKGHTTKTNSVVFSPDGQRLATASSDDAGVGEIKIWDASFGTELLTLPEPRGIRALAMSPNGQLLASVNFEGVVNLRELSSGHERLRLNASAKTVAFSPDGSRMVTGSGSRGAIVWDVVTGKELLSFQLGTGVLHSVLFSPNGRTIASAASSWAVGVWDAGTGEKLSTLQVHDGPIHCLAFSPDGQRLASAGMDRTVKVWNVVTRKESLTLKGHTGPVYHVSFSPDAQRLVSVSEGDKVKVWNAETGEELVSLSGQKTAAFSPDSRRLAVPSNDGTVTVWGAQPKRHEILEKQLEIDPGNSAVRRQLTATYTMLGVDDLEAGILDDARRYFFKSLEICEKLEAGQSNAAYLKNTLSKVTALAWEYLIVGRLDECVALLEQTLNLQKAKLDPRDPDTLLSRYSLAIAYREARRDQGAEPLLREAVGISREQYGIAAPLTRLLMLALSVCYVDLRQFEKAEPLSQELATYWKNQPAQESQEHASQLANAGLDFLGQKKPILAEAVIRECLLIRESVQPNDWRTFNSISMLGGSLIGRKRFEDVEPLLLSGYKGMKEREHEIPPDGKLRMTEAIQRLIDLYDVSNQKAKADEWKAKLRIENGDSASSNAGK